MIRELISDMIMISDEDRDRHDITLIHFFSEKSVTYRQNKRNIYGTFHLKSTKPLSDPSPILMKIGKLVGPMEKVIHAKF